MADYNYSVSGYSQAQMYALYSQWDRLNSQIDRKKQETDLPTVPQEPAVQQQPEKSEHTTPEVDAKTQQKLAKDTLLMFLNHDNECAMRLLSKNLSNDTRQTVYGFNYNSEKSSPLNQASNSGQTLSRPIINNHGVDMTQRDSIGEVLLHQWTLINNKFIPHAIPV